MCLIIDNNVRDKVLLNNDKNYLPVKKALFEKRNVMIYGGKLREEYLKSGKVKRILKELDRAGIAVSIKDSIINGETKAVIGLGICKSNDEHIVALARVSGARLLCSEDLDLHHDFKNKKLLNSPRGKIYQNTAHIDILNNNCIKCKHH